MEEDKGKKYRYTYYTATGKEEIDVDENWYEILRQADKEIWAFTAWVSIYVYGTIQRNVSAHGAIPDAER